jgi:hypothetical protein
MTIAQQLHKSAMHGPGKNPNCPVCAPTCIVRAGDHVTIVNQHGQERTGRAVMRGPHGWVLNMGGPHGTPAIATDDNITRVKRTRRGE